MNQEPHVVKASSGEFAEMLSAIGMEIMRKSKSMVEASQDGMEMEEITITISAPRVVTGALDAIGRVHDETCTNPDCPGARRRIVEVLFAEGCSSAIIHFKRLLSGTVVSEVLDIFNNISEDIHEGGHDA